MPLGTENIGMFFAHSWSTLCSATNLLCGGLFVEYAVLRYEPFVMCLVYGVCCAPLRTFCDVSCLWSTLCSATGFMRISLLSFLKLIFLYYYYIFHQIVILEVGFRLFPLLLYNLVFYNFV